jgi:5-methyltetrahydrofolate--homocysteine methyltransferase
MAIGGRYDVSAIMNPVQLATSRKKYDEHIAKLAELGIIIPEDADPAVLAPLLGAGHMTGTPSKEIEAIKAADFLLNNDEGGAAWIRFNKPAGGGAEGARGRREGGRRRRG